MHIGKPESFNSNQPLASGTQAIVKIPVPQSSFQINADSLKWVDKLGSLTGKYITSSIKSGKIFKINELGASTFGIPAFSAQGTIQRPILNFTLDNNHNLNLASIDMQSSTGNLHRWASAPDTVNSVTPPIPSASPDVVADTPPPLPQRPANWVTQSSVRMEISNNNQAKMNVQTMGSMRADDVSFRQQNAPRHNSVSNMPPSPSASFVQRTGVQRKETVQPAPPLPPRPNVQTQQASEARTSQTSTASGIAENVPGPSLDEMEQFLTGPSFSNSRTAPLARPEIQRREVRQPAPPLPPRPNVQTQQASEARISRTSTASGTAENVPGPSLDEMEQFLTGPSFSNSRTAPLARPEIQRRVVRQPAPPLPPRPNVQTQQASEARTSRTSTASGIAENVPGPSLNEMEQFLTGPPLPPKMPHNASFPAQSASNIVGMDVPDSLRPGPGQRRQSDFISRPNLQTQQVPEARSSQTSTASESAENVPGPSLDEREQFLTGPPLPPKIRHAASLPAQSSSDMDRMDVPDSLRPGPARRRQSDFITRPNVQTQQVPEARSSQTSTALESNEGIPGPSLDEMEQFLTGPPLPPKIRHAASFPTLPASDMDRMDVPDSLRPGPARRRQSDFINRDFSTTVPDSLRPGRTKPLSSPASSIEVQSQLMAANLLASQHSTLVNSSNSSQKIFTNIQSMQNVYRGEETGIIFGTKVKYLNAQERAAYKVTIKDGKVYDSAGRLFDTRQASTAFALNKGRAIFVMDASGSMYISNEQTKGKFHHSSFFSGGPVAAAGDVRIENGVMTVISRKSGHYRPTESQLNQAVNHLKKQGISGVFIDEDLS